MSAPYTITETNNNTYVIYPDGGPWYTTGGTNDPNCTIAVCPVEISVYGYRPSLAASISLITLYALCAVIQVFLGIRYKMWGFMVAMVLGCIDEIMGYVGRIIMWQNPWNSNGFIMQIVLVTMGPVFFSAAIYVMIYKIIKYISPAHSRVKPWWLYAFFISCDVIALTLQAIGGGMSSSSNGASQVGVNIALAGLSFQVATLFFFVACVIDYALRSRNVWMNYTLSGRFKIFCTFLGFATLLIWIRCCYRVYELSQGYSDTSAALRDEPLFIGLESCMVIVAAYCLIVAHPGFVFERRARSGDVGPAAQEKVIAEGKERDAVGGGSGSD